MQKELNNKKQLNLKVICLTIFLYKNDMTFLEIHVTLRLHLNSVRTFQHFYTWSPTKRAWRAM